MQKLNLTIFFGLILTLVVGGSAFGQIGKTKSKKNQQPELPPNGWLNIATAPEVYPLFINGAERGMTHTSNTNPIDRDIPLDPGTYDVEIRFPNKSYTKTVTIERGKRNCMCLTYSTRKTTRPCPYNVTVDAPTAVTDGDNIIFTADPHLVEGPPVNLNYKWTLSPETVQIREGKGTPSITVDSTGLGGQRLIAVLEVDSGYDDAACRQRIPVTVDVKPLEKKPPPTMEFDRFDFTNNDAMKARLDNFTIALQNQPDMQAYIIVYGRRGGTAKEADRLGIRAMEYLVRNKKFDPRRIIVVNGGFRQRAGFELYLVPPGADPPTPRPQ